MGYENYVEMTFKNVTATPLQFQNVVISWGKYYPGSDKTVELSPTDVSNAKIDGHSTYKFGACGRESSPSGCEGKFEIVTNEGKVVAKINFDSPWGNTARIFNVDAPDSNWLASVKGANLTGTGAVGDVTVTLMHMP